MLNPPLHVRGLECGLVLFSHTVARRSLWNRYPKWVDGMALGVLGKARIRKVRAGPLALAGTTFDAPLIDLVDPSVADANEGVDGLIGMELLRRFTITVEAERDTLRLQPDAALHQPFHADRSGLTVAEGPRGVSVDRVATGSPAAKAGLAVGDEVYPATPMPLQAFRWSLSDVPGVVVEFDAVRAGRTIPIRLTLEELI